AAAETERLARSVLVYRRVGGEIRGAVRERLGQRHGPGQAVALGGAGQRVGLDLGDAQARVEDEHRVDVLDHTYRIVDRRAVGLRRVFGRVMRISRVEPEAGDRRYLQRDGGVHVIVLRVE